MKKLFCLIIVGLFLNFVSAQSLQQFTSIKKNETSSYTPKFAFPIQGDQGHVLIHEGDSNFSIWIISFPTSNYDRIVFHLGSTIDSAIYSLNFLKNLINNTSKNDDIKFTFAKYEFISRSGHFTTIYLCPPIGIGKLEEHYARKEGSGFIKFDVSDREFGMLFQISERAIDKYIEYLNNIK